MFSPSEVFTYWTGGGVVTPATSPRTPAPAPRTPSRRTHRGPRTRSPCRCTARAPCRLSISRRRPPSPQSATLRSPRAEQVSLLFNGLSGIQPNSHEQWFCLGLVTFGEGTLEGNSAVNALCHRPEGRHEPVAHRLDLGAAVVFEDVPGDRFVLAQHVPATFVAEAGHHFGVPNEVGEEHGAEGRCRCRRRLGLYCPITHQ